MQPLLLLHGAIGAKDQLQPIAHLLNKQFDVYDLNFSGHGGEVFAEDFSIRQFAAEVIMFLNKNNIPRINIFGYSMGGYVAMHLALHYPEKINKVITLATKFYWDEPVAAKEMKMLDAGIIEQKIPAFAAQLKERHAPNDWRGLLDRTKELLQRLGEHNAIGLADYKRIPHPCLLLLGGQDKMVTKEETIAVADALPHAIFNLLPGVPHPIEQVDAGMLANIISGFVDDVVVNND